MELKIRPKARHTITPSAKTLEVSKFSHLPETKNIFQNALTSIELDGTNLWEDFKVKVLSAAQDTLGFWKSKCQDWFVENYEKIDTLLETKRNLFQKSPRICPTKQKWKLQKHTRIFRKWHKCICVKYKISGGSRRQKKHNLQQKLEIVLLNYQRALWAAAINFCSPEIKRWCHLEMTRRYQEAMYQCFIDLSKAFDTVNRSTLWKISLKLGCPERFTGLIHSLHNGMKARVSFNRTLRKYLSTMGSNRVTFLHPCYSISTLPLSFS